MKEYASFIGMTTALAAMSAWSGPIEGVRRPNDEPRVKGPTKDVRKRRKAVKKARRKNRRQKK